MFNTHECTTDDRGQCEECMNNRIRREEWKKVYGIASNILNTRIPDDLPEFPDAYEFGRMENGEWN
jgi:hypothetical protein